MMKWRPETHTELLDQAYKGSIPTSLFSTIAGLLFCIVLWPQVPTFLLLPWLILFLIAQIFRIGTSLYRQKYLKDESEDFWRTLLYISVIFSALMWGVFPVLTFFHVDEMTRAIISIFLATAPTAQLLTIAGIFTSWMISMLIMLIPMSIAWLFFGMPGVVLGSIGFLYAGYLYAVGRKFNNLMGEKLELTAKADAASQAKTKFLATASHDLRQPIHAMTMSLAAAQARLEHQFPTPDEINSARNSLETLDRSVESLSQLLNALLDVSKLESGGIEPTFSAMPVTNLFEHLDKTYKLRALDKGLNFTIVPSKLVLQTDPIYIQRIISNLVSNAIRHVNKGKILIGCRRKGKNARIYVIDNGPGIPMEKFRDIFAEFSQLDNPARQSNAGQGLGLSFADRMARALEHTLSVYSLPNQGATFTLDVPLSENVPDTVDKASKDIVGRRQTQLIVLLDPNTEVLEETAVQLRNWGYRVLAFQSCEEAQALQVRPQLIISAQNFQNGISGFKVVNILRGTWRRDAPAIVTISDLDPDALLEASTYKCRIIPNPPDPDEFRKTIHKAIAKIND